MFQAGKACKAAPNAVLGHADGMAGGNSSGRVLRIVPASQRLDAGKINLRMHRAATGLEKPAAIGIDAVCQHVAARDAHDLRSGPLHPIGDHS